MVMVPRFHCPMPLAVGAQVDLPPAVCHHAVRVLRLRSGDRLTLFNGEGGEYVARISGAERSQISAEVLQWLPAERESSLPVTLVQALQTGEKMDLTVQKAVELGVSRIVPVASRRSIVQLDDRRAARRVEHWRAIVVAACEQCGRNRLPSVDAPQGLDAWLRCSPPPGVLRLLLAPSTGQSLHQMGPDAAMHGVELLVGAEGGLTPEEERFATSAGFRPVRLGPRVLRTETAGLTALVAVQLLWGDLREERTDV